MKNAHILQNRLPREYVLKDNNSLCCVEVGQFSLLCWSSY